MQVTESPLYTNTQKAAKDLQNIPKLHTNPNFSQGSPVACLRGVAQPENKLRAQVSEQTQTWRSSLYPVLLDQH